jgi:hypothetical protein
MIFRSKPALVLRLWIMLVVSVWTIVEKIRELYGAQTEILRNSSDKEQPSLQRSCGARWVTNTSSVK